MSPSQIVVHSQYNSTTLINDIALLKLTNPVPILTNVQIIRLPKRAEVNTLVVGEPAIASGWGWPSDAAKGLSANLRYISLPVVANSVCQNTYGRNLVTSSNVCVSGANKKGTW